jgi:multicomponent Na+:H+ antiporter subunit D
MTSMYPSLLFLIPFGAALLAALVGWWIEKAPRWFALVGLGATALVATSALFEVIAVGTLHTHLGNWPPPIGIELVLDPLSAGVAVLVAWTALAVLAGSREAIQTQLRGVETSFYATSLLLVSGLIGMVVTGDLFNLFVQLEVASLSAYALVAAGQRGAPKAALNYLIVGSLGASLYLLGVGFIYAGTGSLNMSDVADRLLAAPAAGTITGLVFIVAGLAVKMALFPVHGWMPGAYALSPSAAAALMAPLVTKVAAYALIRVLFWVYGAAFVKGTPMLTHVLSWAGILAILVGGVLAFTQKDLWRLLAYSSVSQIGLVALGAGLANTSGMTGAVLHIANDALMKGALFLAAGVALIRFKVRTVDQLGRLRGRAPWTIGAIAVAGISLIGLPPLAGFFSKWYVLWGAIEAGQWISAAAVILGTLITAAYVFRILEPLLFAPPLGAEELVVEGPFGMVAAGAVFAVAIVVLGIANERVVSLVVKAALPGGL